MKDEKWFVDVSDNNDFILILLTQNQFVHCHMALFQKTFFSLGHYFLICYHFLRLSVDDALVRSPPWSCRGASRLGLPSAHWLYTTDNDSPDRPPDRYDLRRSERNMSSRRSDQFHISSPLRQRILCHCRITRKFPEKDRYLTNWVIKKIYALQSIFL